MPPPSAQQLEDGALSATMEALGQAVTSFENR
jgi:hypothetical protein